MKNKLLLVGTIIRTVFVALESIAAIVLAIYSFLSAGNGIWGYWGSLLAMFGLISPIIIYLIPSLVFNTYNLIIVVKHRHTPDSIKKYQKWSKTFLIWGIITGGIYGTILIPIFLLENIFLFIAYTKERDLI